jgi:hypothetical protein
LNCPSPLEYEFATHTPITEVLDLIRDNHWNIQATIEFEYPIPPGSDRMTEIARAIRYCRDVLA